MDGTAAKLDEGMTLWPVKAEQIDAVWGRVHPEIERSMARADGLIEAKDVYDALKSRDMQLWIIFKGEAIKAVCVTQIIVYPGRTIIRIVGLSGYGMAQWYDLIEAAGNWAKHNGAEEYQALVGNPKLVKMLERKGWKQTHTVMTRPV